LTFAEVLVYAGVVAAFALFLAWYWGFLDGDARR
jgi:hypothetical protein